ncbi:hypothetical protein [Polyangium jinanense]|uniref:Uncharacterized protein n=1 Tax=Polyangium jinanense TaxID=2829994 RepID=A0A9X3X131_9BACT|nr:hypothetical protein [Polyangium jinanense]MDC3953438.1 hypothetical protein [Polyangium jinanense]MDC3979441.1 hypothetical protein [Polyangium jinanense]
MTARPARPKGAPPAGASLVEQLALSADGVEAIVAFHIADGKIHAAWIRPGSGYTAGAVTQSLREVYKTSQVHARRLDFLAPTPMLDPGPADLSDPLITLEMPGRVIVIRRVHGHVVAVSFDGTVPLGFVRYHAARIAMTLRPELPQDSITPPSGVPAVSAPPPTVNVVSKPQPDEADHEEPARTLAFPTGGAVVVRSSRPPPRGTKVEIDRATKLLAYLDAHAPDPHVVRLRVALRAGIKPLALDHPESLGADAMVLLETAAEDILGIDRAELRSKI